MDFLKSQIENFLIFLQTKKNRVAGTITNYKFYLTRFALWCQSQKIKNLEQLTLEKIRLYRIYLSRINTQDLEPLSPKTQYYHLLALRNFIKFLNKQDLPVLSAIKIELEQPKIRKIEFLDFSEISRLLEAPLLTKEAEILRLRDHAILETLFSTGLKVSELVNLPKKLLEKEPSEINITTHGKTRPVFISKSANEAIKKYLASRKDNSPLAFISHDKASGLRNQKETKPMTARSYERLVEKYGKIAGITKKVTPKNLRHSFATDLIKNGADLSAVQKMLGHKTIATTQVYNQISTDSLKELHNKFHSEK